jgi:hypothetical protein
MVQFSISDYPIFLLSDPFILLVANVSVTAVSCVVASMDKTLSRS